MATTDDDSVFIDTNVLVYAVIPAAPRHTDALDLITRLEQAGRELWISRQILREFLAVLSRPQAFSSPISVEIITSAIRKLESRFIVSDEGADTTNQLLSLVERARVGGKQVHDANIVATMVTEGVRYLLTYNRGDFERFQRLGLVELLPT